MGRYDGYDDLENGRKFNVFIKEFPMVRILPLILPEFEHVNRQDLLCCPITSIVVEQLFSGL